MTEEVPKIKVFKVHREAVLPKYATERSACFDLCACLVAGNQVKYQSVRSVDSFQHKEYSMVVGKTQSIVVYPGERMLVPTGLILDIPSGYSVRLHPRSGLSYKNGITLANAEGVIDEDYVDPTFVLIHNISSLEFVINHGDRICQAELVKVNRCDIVATDIKPESKTSRTGGFGSTGVTS